MSGFDPNNPYAPKSGPSDANDPGASSERGAAGSSALSPPQGSSGSGAVPGAFDGMAPLAVIAPVPAGIAPPPPREPSVRARALVCSLGGGDTGGIIVGVVLILIGSVFSWVFVRSIPLDLALSSFASRTRGTVLAEEVDRTIEVNGTSPNVIRFRYEVDGET